MAADDWAIVVGVRFYPGLTNLDGPVNDAWAVQEWLLSPAGGDVPRAQLALITSPQYNPPLPPPQNAEPKFSFLQEAFDNLVYVADQHAAARKGKRVGRRLYIYMSGHGCAPRLNDSALLAANATRTIVGYHILGRMYADWFLRSNYFDEVVLWMDCCRESYPQAPPSIPPYIDFTGPEALDKAKRFYGLATKWSRVARERLMDDGLFHGVFTFALLQGLKGAACDPKTGQITAETLGNYIYSTMKYFSRPGNGTNGEPLQDPDIDYDKNPAAPFVIATVPVPTFKVTVDLAASAAGKKVEILTDKFNVEKSANAVPPSWEVELKRGTYMLQIIADNLQKPFEVVGTGDVHVRL
jgi:hypothetical protein